MCTRAVARYKHSRTQKSRVKGAAKTSAMQRKPVVVVVGCSTAIEMRREASADRRKDKECDKDHDDLSEASSRYEKHSARGQRQMIIVVLLLIKGLHTFISFASRGTPSTLG